MLRKHLDAFADIAHALAVSAKGAAGAPKM
jgi:hypothetical protein